MGGATNFISGSGGNIRIQSDTFALSASNMILSSSNGGLVLLGGTTYTNASASFSGSGQGKFGNINFDGRSGGSIFTGTTSLTSTTAGFFMSGSGELNFVRANNE